MIGISETPGAFNRVGMKAASVGYSHVGISHGPTASFLRVRVEVQREKAAAEHSQRIAEAHQICRSIR
jgi:hypothetical protein